MKKYKRFTVLVPINMFHGDESSAVINVEAELNKKLLGWYHNQKIVDYDIINADACNIGNSVLHSLHVSYTK